jgi:MFS family permease
VALAAAHVNLPTLDRAFRRTLALRWLATVVALPALVPLFLARGLDLTHIGLIMATYAAVTAALELPTGGLADALGRIPTTLVADALGIGSRLVFLLAPDLSGLLIAAALAGAGRALGSATLEAWYVDARNHLDPGGDLRAPLARAGVMQSLALALGTLVGGALPLLAPLLGIGGAGSVAALQLSFLASLPLGLAAWVAVARLPERRATLADGRRALQAARPDRVAGVAWRAVARDPLVALLMVVGAIFGGVVMSLEAFLPAELQARWGAAGVSTVLGVVMAAGFVATAAGQALAAAGRRAGANGAPLAQAAVGTTLLALAVGGLAIAPGSAALATAAAALAASLVYAGLGYALPSLGAAFHARVAAGERATLLSARSLAGYAGGVAATLGLGTVAEGVGLGAVWLIAAAGALFAATALAAYRPEPLAARTEEPRVVP